MSGFTSIVVIGNKEYQFHFSKVFCPMGQKYFVAVWRNGKQVTFFEVRRNGGDWRLVYPVVPLVKAQEQRIIALIQDHSNKQEYQQEPE